DLRVHIACDFTDAKLGESIAVNGVCLTVTDISPLPLWEEGGGILDKDISSQDTPHPLPSPARGEGVIFIVDVSAETLARTAPRWKKGERVNIERSLRMGDMLSGHLVSGHVDGVAIIKEITASQGSHILCLEAPGPLLRFIAEKGSVTLDGVSLTVNKVEGARFWVNIIPHTWQNTTLKHRRLGDALNLEVDMMARYVDHLVNTGN
ncbi:MAG: riboflavin synthase, partial [Pseudomonadota bacterium]|nr:riboflavin synthase [Pseudomonadota bacterium]